MFRVAPPATERDLLERAAALEGHTLASIAEALGRDAAPFAAGNHLRTKGKAGELLEQALGATGGSAARHDFPHLRVELKTVPVDAKRLPRESTFVCAFALAEADALEWDTSWVREKLGCVLWVPILEEDERRVGRPLLWRPTRAQEDVLRADFEDLVGTIGMGALERVTAHQGRWLQVRPKAATGRVRTSAIGWDGEALESVPRGFYLRARFTGALLADPAALPA